MIYLLSKPLTKSLNCVNKARLHKRSHFVYTRIAKANNMSKEKVGAIIEKCTDSRFLGVFGEKTVNVLKVNLMLDGILCTSQHILDTKL